LTNPRYSVMGSDVVKDQLILLFRFQRDMFYQLYKIQKANPNTNLQRTDYQKVVQGHLVQMRCGHRGIPYRIEEKRVSRLLRKSGFLPTLEQVQEFQKKISQSIHSTDFKTKQGNLSIDIKM
jgi:hypothetical protein